MGGIPRLHHFIPKSYLYGFAIERKKDQWMTNVSDFESHRAYPTNVRNVCAERDFLMVDLPGTRPDIIETLMSDFEGKCIGAIRRVASSGRLEGEDGNLTLNLMALLAVRSPRQRSHFGDAQIRLFKVALDLLVSSPEIYKSEIARMRASGGPTADVPYEHMKAFIQSQKGRLSVSREHHIETEIHLFDTVLQELGRRYWTIYLTDEATGHFITSNRPVILSYTDPSFEEKSSFPPGFATPQTDIVFPLTSNALAVGRWVESEPSVHAHTKLVASLNTHIVVHCEGQVFSRNPEFVYMTLDGEVCRDSLITSKMKMMC